MTEDAPTANWGFPTPVRFGAGRASEIASALAEIGAHAPLVVTDAGLAGHDMVTSLAAALSGAGLAHALFCDVKPNPTDANVEAGVAAFREGRHDCVIAIGGGSALDAGKAVAFMAGQDAPIWTFEDVGDNWRKARRDAIAPVIAIPTTAGTGSEFGRASVITRLDTHRKVIVFHPDMLPRLVVMDPALTVGLPAGLTAATGMDALSHALEAFSAPGYHPMADGLAVQALAMIATALPAAYRDGTDMAARADMLAASGMACIALQKGLGGVHALSHPLGAVYDAHHGLLNAVLLPHVLRHNWPAVAGRMAGLAPRIGLGDAPQAVLDWVVALRRSLDIPDTLGAIGVTVEDPAGIADMAVEDPSAAGNPVPFDRAAALSILSAAR